jgi:predicted DNA-binding ArsR family transcriptional regulator
MTQEEKVKEIKEKIEALINKGIKLLESNYDIDDTKNDNPAYITMVYLNSALWELDFLDEENLKIKN